MEKFTWMLIRSLYLQFQLLNPKESSISKKKSLFKYHVKSFVTVPASWALKGSVLLWEIIWLKVMCNNASVFSWACIFLVKFFYLNQWNALITLFAFRKHKNMHKFNGALSVNGIKSIVKKFDKRDSLNVQSAEDENLCY